MAGDDLTFFERLSIQMEHTVPLVRGLQKVLGEEVVAQALNQLNEQRAVEARENFPKDQPRDARVVEEGLKMYGEGALEYDVLEVSETRADFNVTKCRYAEMMHELGAADLGPLLVCNEDFGVAEQMGLTLERSQTCMQGAEYCDFRYRVREK